MCQACLGQVSNEPDDTRGNVEPAGTDQELRRSRLGQVSLTATPRAAALGFKLPFDLEATSFLYRSPSHAFSDFPEVKQITTQRSQELMQGHPVAYGGCDSPLGMP